MKGGKKSIKNIEVLRATIGHPSQFLCIHFYHTFGSQPPKMLPKVDMV